MVIPFGLVRTGATIWCPCARRPRSSARSPSPRRVQGPWPPRRWTPASTLQMDATPALTLAIATARVATRSPSFPPGGLARPPQTARWASCRSPATALTMPWAFRAPRSRSFSRWSWRLRINAAAVGARRFRPRPTMAQRHTGCRTERRRPSRASGRAVRATDGAPRRSSARTTTRRRWTE